MAKLIENHNYLASKINQTIESISKAKENLQKLDSVSRTIDTIKQDIERHKSDLGAICSEFGLDINQMVNLEINTVTLDSQIAGLNTRIRNLEQDNQIDFSKHPNLDDLESLKDFHDGYEYFANEIKALKEKLGTPQRKYQNYRDQLNQWKAQRLAILGEEKEPQSGTIRFIEAQKLYIGKNLNNILSEKRASREKIVKEIFESKEHILKFYSDLKASVEDTLESAQRQEFSVNIDASFILDRTFPRDFLRHINKNRKGPFHGSNDSEKILKRLMDGVDWNDFDSIYEFFKSIIKAMTSYKDEELQIEDQVVDKKEFYNFLSSLDYLSAQYELRLGSKNLNALSPGEKGLLLLVFYLQLDKTNTPLVIDQPEDNLDNESIYSVLAHCIREAKEKRQVILVTHNPNLAVGADAEQIIFVKLEKAKNHKFSYETGAIENPDINDKIVMVLEGSQPAFIKRRLTYEM